MIEAQRAIVASSVAWMDAFFDAEANLLRYPSNSRWHAVRESLWYAAGLLVLRREDRALRVFDAVLALQFDQPGAIWDGTWPRAPEEAKPRDGAMVWRDYDPNWRQFIGCLLGVMLRDFAQTLGPARCDDARAAIARAIRGEPPARIAAGYSNIALMQAWLLCELGDRAQGERLAAEIEQLYREEGGFREFNSPTYYGVDLWGLALWRRSGSALLVAAGQRLEDALWRDIGMFYHPGMRNLCGPYDRAYGLDMTRYASLLGLWMWWAGGEGTRAFPDVSRPFGHAHDFCAAPLMAFAPPTVPEEVHAALSAPVQERTVARRIGNRTVTAMLRRDLMLGAVDRAAHDPNGQATPITAHWFDENGDVAWLCIRGALRGRVADTRVILSSDVELSLLCSGMTKLGSGEWIIGGRAIQVNGVEVTSRNHTNHTLKVTSDEAVLVFA